MNYELIFIRFMLRYYKYYMHAKGYHFLVYHELLFSGE